MRGTLQLYVLYNLILRWPFIIHIPCTSNINIPVSAGIKLPSTTSIAPTERKRKKKKKTKLKLICKHVRICQNLNPENVVMFTSCSDVDDKQNKRINWRCISSWSMLKTALYKCLYIIIKLLLLVLNYYYYYYYCCCYYY